MNGLLAHHADDIAVRAEEANALRDEHLRIPAADPRDVHVAILIDVLDDHADLVNVPGEHDDRDARREPPSPCCCRARRTPPSRTFAASSRHTRAGAASKPDGPGVSSSRFRKVTDVSLSMMSESVRGG